MTRIIPAAAISAGILAALLLSSCGPAPGELNKKYEFISPAALNSLLREKNAVVIDTMSDLECMDHRIPSSVCVPVEEFEARIPGLLQDKKKTLVFYSDSEESPRAKMAADKAKAAGFEDVRILEGALAGWKRMGYDVETVKRVQRKPVMSVKRGALADLASKKKELFILDIRSEDAFKAGHLEGAVNIPLHMLQQRLKEIPVNRPILVVDENGKRSFLVSCYLVDRGYRDVIRLYGGMEHDQPQRRRALRS